MRRPVTAETTGSNPVHVASFIVVEQARCMRRTVNPLSKVRILGPQPVPVSTFQKVPCGNDKVPVAMAPLAQSNADNIAAFHYSWNFPI